ncbi:hypothetical protein RYH80_15115 [Halobaculum sp. MBLA0147]|uniref:hypothetical protein n=1 Tax=Halobaculum sp. MBLA0147 TaxID=3079934 RepID=UPI0035243460
MTRDTRAIEESEAPGIERRPDSRERRPEAPNGATTGSSANGSTDADSDGADAAERHARARRTLDRHAATVERRTLRRALRRLEDQGGLSPAQRTVVERLVERLGDGVLAGPRATLAVADGDASRTGDRDPSRDVDGDGSRTDGGDENGTGSAPGRADTAAVVDRLFGSPATESDE